MDALDQFLRPLLLTGHLVASALAGAGPLVCAALRLHPATRQVGDDSLRRLATWSLWALAIGLALGGALAALAWLDSDEAYRAAAARFPSSAYGFLAAEWAFTALFYAFYLVTWRKLSRLAWLHGLIALVGTTNLLYHFPTMMIVLGAVADDPLLAAESQITRPVLLRLFLTPELMAKTAHFWSASLLIAGIGALWVGARGGDNSEPENPLAVGGGSFALVGLGMALVSGVVTLTQLPAGPQRELMGGNLVASLALLSGVLAAVGLGHTLLPMALGEAPRAAVRRAAILTLATIACMAVASSSV